MSTPAAATSEITAFTTRVPYTIMRRADMAPYWAVSRSLWKAWSSIAAVTIAWTEMLVAALLYAGAAVRGAALVSGALLFTFLIAIFSAMARGLEINCGCFAGSEQTVGWPKVVEDLALLAGAIFLIYFPRSYAMIGDMWGRVGVRD